MGDTTVNRYDKDDHTVWITETAEIKQAVFDRLKDWYLAREAYEGEVIFQNDECQLTATELLCDIADDVMKFRIDWED